jgi:uncharacterized membrane protein YcaP (DUF421 family)
MNIQELLGLNQDPKSLTFLQTSLRGLVTFVVALVMLRLSDKRFLSKKTAFDALLGFVLASMLARAVNGSAAFFPTLGCGFVLIGLHRLLAYFARVSHRFGLLVKGESQAVVKDGAVIDQTMRQNDLTERDLIEDLRLNGNVDSPSKIKAAFIERNGQISVVK